MLDFITLLIGILFVVFLIGSFVLFLYLLIRFIKKSNFKAKQQKGKREIETSYKENKENADIGMYFMDMYNAAGKRINITYQHELEVFYFLVGLAAQGRTEEIEDIYKEEAETLAETLASYVFEGTNEDVIEKGGIENRWLLFLKEIKPRLLKMSKIAEKVDNMDMEDIKDGESIGEWQSRKLRGYKTFMKGFEYFKNYDIETTLKKIL